jgi:hypothetical protein
MSFTSDIPEDLCIENDITNKEDKKFICKGGPTITSDTKLCEICAVLKFCLIQKLINLFNSYNIEKNLSLLEHVNLIENHWVLRKNGI